MGIGTYSQPRALCLGITHHGFVLAPDAHRPIPFTSPQRRQPVCSVHAPKTHSNVSTPFPILPPAIAPLPLHADVPLPGGFAVVDPDSAGASLVSTDPPAVAFEAHDEHSHLSIGSASLNPESSANPAEIPNPRYQSDHHNHQGPNSSRSPHESNTVGPQSNTATASSAVAPVVERVSNSSGSRKAFSQVEQLDDTHAVVAC